MHGRQRNHRNHSQGISTQSFGGDGVYMMKMLRCALDENIGMIVRAVKSERERLGALGSEM